MAMSPKVRVVALPRLSAHVPLTDWPSPSVLTVAGAVTVATPEPASVQVKRTTTGWFVHVPGW